jgi:aspartate kinase
MAKLYVVKYGGSVLDSGKGIRRAAESTKEEYEKGTGLVLVVSAMKGMTDRLLDAANEISPDTPLEVVDHIIGLGEEQSVRLMVSALRGMGVDAVEITPDSPSWPIVTDENFGNAEPIIEECIGSAELTLKPLIERGKVPVVCGFIGRSPNGAITTLGRGGSDTTGVILAQCLKADELVLVKDVAGVYSADPKKVPSANSIDHLSAWEANLMASTGAKVLHDKVFKYKPRGLKIRIISKNSPLDGDGTVIDGTLPEISVETHKNPVSLVNIVGDLVSSPEGLALFSSAVELKGGKVLGFSGSSDSSLFVVDGPASEVLKGVHTLVDSGRAKAVTNAEDLAYVIVKGRGLDSFEAVRTTKAALTSIGIKVPWVQVGSAHFSLLLSWDRLQEALEEIRKTIGR